MSRVTLTLPPQVQVSGVLRTPAQPHYLDQDMLSLQFPNGIVIDVGWYPDCDPNGKYRLVVFRGAFENQLEATLCTKDVRVIVNAIYSYVEKYLQLVEYVDPNTTTCASVEVNGQVIPAPPSALIVSVSSTRIPSFV